MFNNCGVNKVFLVGVISKEPRWHKSSQQTDMLCFNLTTQENIGKAGHPVEHLETHVLKIPEKNVLLNFKKGQTVHVEGKVHTISFIDEQEIRRYKTEILVNRIIILSEAEAAPITI